MRYSLLSTYIFFFSMIVIPILGHGQISSWKTLMSANGNYSYFLGTEEPPPDWTTLDFNDDAWLVGQGGIGYADGDDNTEIPKVLSLFMRQTFVIDDLDKLENLRLYADYDDGFVAYLNGVEIARANLEGSPPTYDTETPDFREALMYDGGLPVNFKLEAFSNLLLPGENVFAVQTHNYEGLVSSDLTTLYWLLADVDDSSGFYSDPPSWFQDLNFQSILPLIVINTGDVEIEDEPSISGTMGIIDNGVANSYLDFPNDYNGNITIEKRGQTSLSMFPKNGYAIELKDDFDNDIDASILGLPEEEDWLLHGPYSDKSLIRNALAMKLARDVGQYASRTKLVELFINDQYEGVYVLMEKIKRDKHRVDIAKLDSTEISDDDLTGGYIIKLDKGPIDWESQYLMVNNNRNLRFQHVYPKRSDIMPEQKEYIKSYVDSMEIALRQNDYTFDGKRYDDFLDLESFVEHFLLMELTKNIDAYRISSYYYKDKDSKGGLLTAGPIWDFNISMGNGDYCNAYTSDGWVYDEHCGIFNPFWWGRMFEDEAFANMAKCKWEEWRNGPILEDVVFNYIDSLALTLVEPAERNFQRWPVLDEYVWPNYEYGGTYLDEVEYIKAFLSARWLWMDDNMIGTCDATLVSDDHGASFVKVYPNPAQDFITIEWEGHQFEDIANYRLFSASGLFSKSSTVFNGGKIDIAAVPEGVYVLEIYDSDSVVIEKIIVSQ